MNEEEQEAIERCKELIDDIFKCDDEDEIIADAYIGGILQILLNLIERQSKKIEGLKEKNKELRNYISKDKIRKRIEELEDLEVDNELYKIALKLAKKELQHLLEEEKCKY